MNKPPIGVMPEYIWKKKRLAKLYQAIGEYKKAGLIPLPEWEVEAYRLEKEIPSDLNNFTKYMEEREKEEPTMRVTYNGFTGELVKLEKSAIFAACSIGETRVPAYHVYNLSIHDAENMVTHSFENVKLEDVKFLGWKVSFE